MDTSSQRKIWSHRPVARALSRMRQNWINVVDHATGDPLEALAATYLTPKHRDGAGRGCPMAALGPEIARQGPPVRHAVTDELRPFLDYLSRIVQGNSSSLRRQKALATYASLIGALIVSRAVDDPALSNEFLNCCGRHHALTTVRSRARRRRRFVAQTHSNRRAAAPKTQRVPRRFDSFSHREISLNPLVTLKTSE